MTLRTVRVPSGMTDVFAAAEAVVARYFGERVHLPERGTIEIAGQRYVLVRAASLSVEFFAVLRKLYGPGREREADDFARNILFDLAHAIGRSDAKNFHGRMSLEDPLARLSAGPVHFAYSGWAFVDIHPESDPQPNEHYCLIYDHPYSFEASAWLEAKIAPAFAACVMNAGYSSGWCAESFRVDLVASEVMCRARGDEACRFVMAHPARIEHMLESYRQKLAPDDALRTRDYPIPDLFARKRVEDELRKSRDELDARVKQRTAELEAANQQLESEIVQRTAAERRLAQAQKLEAIGRLAGGIAHDFNNLLGVILGRSSTVQSRLDRSDPLWEEMDAIRIACRQGASLTRHMIAFSRGQPVDVRAIDLGELVTSFTGEIRPLVGEDVDIVVDVDSDEPTVVMADRAELEQVLINLVVNARDAMQTGGHLAIRTSRINIGDLPVTTTTLPAGAYAVLSVRDTGVGIDRETQARVFDPFFSTKPAGEGTGLGLATVYRIVHQAKGGIALESSPGEGTTFTIYLPSSTDPATTLAGREEARPAPVSRHGGARILLVDDKHELRDAIEQGLVASGYQVVAVGDPLRALELVERGGLEADILLTDLSMPELGGRELAVRVRSKRPHIGVLYMSGHDRDRDHDHATSPDDRNVVGAPVVQKPFAIEDLVAHIEELRKKDA